jgi:1-acyl-sn-glycerol-3-phosphate acyltransferase
MSFASPLSPFRTQVLFTMLDFRPPMDQPVLLNFVKAAMPAYMRVRMKGLQVKPVDGAIERFKKTAKQRAMICPNHSNRHDPQAMFAFSTQVGEDFNFVAAREVFDYDEGKNGWWLQHLGCYSVVRGAPDRESFKMTRKIIAEGKKKLVLFPEGEISRQNDTLMPLESGAAQLSFWGVEELAKQSGENGSGLPPCYIIPIAMKYTYPNDIRPELWRVLSLLEEKLGIGVSDKETFHNRLKNLTGKLLVTLEKEYEFKPKEGATVTERVDALRTHVLTTVGRQLNITLQEGGKQLDWVRQIRNKLDDFIYADDASGSEYEKKIHDEKAATIKGYYRDMDRVVNFIAIYESYFAESNTQERFADTLDRLESEILGHEPSIKGARTVLLDVGEAIDISAKFSEYKAHKKAVIAEVTHEISHSIEKMLVKLDNYRKPIM